MPVLMAGIHWFHWRRRAELMGTTLEGFGLVAVTSIGGRLDWVAALRILDLRCFEGVKVGMA